MYYRLRFRRKSSTPKPLQQAAKTWIEGLENRLLLAGNGLAGVYYNSADLSGSPVAARVDPTVNFIWSGSPAAKVNADNFSVRWSGQVVSRYSGLYTFLTSSDDGVRLTVNGKQIINNWTKHAATINTGTITL